MAADANRVPSLVVAALRGEVASFLGLLAPGKAASGRVGAARFVRGEIAGRPMVVAWTGDGARCAGAGLHALLDAVPVRRVLVVGVAGALSPDLDAGTVVAGERIVDPDGDVPAPELSWRPASGARTAVQTGILYSSPRIAVTREEKADIWQALGRPSVAAVDLETATFARVARERDVSFAALRAVSDTAAETLPVDFNRMLDAHGRVRQASVAGWALRHPWAIPRLVTLARRVSQCAASLTAAGLPWIAQEEG